MKNELKYVLRNLEEIEALSSNPRIKALCQSSKDIIKKLLSEV